jgi:hypothetical protein
MDYTTTLKKDNTQIDCPNTKILFIHLPRTGGTFLSNLHNDIPEFQVLQRHVVASKAAGLQNYFSIGFVRNPFDWYVSRFEYYKNTRPNTIEGGISKKNDLGLCTIEFNKHYKTLKHHILDGLNAKLDRFWLNQMYTHCFCNKNQDLLIDYVGKYEDMNKCIHYALSKINAKYTGDISKLSYNKNASARQPYIKYYDQELIDIILEKDKMIFDTYNYEF